MIYPSYLTMLYTCLTRHCYACMYVSRLFSIHHPPGGQSSRFRSLSSKQFQRVCDTFAVRLMRRPMIQQPLNSVFRARYRCLLAAPVVERGSGLVNREDEDLGDVDVGRASRSPHDLLGNVFRDDYKARYISARHTGLSGAHLRGCRPS